MDNPLDNSSQPNHGSNSGPDTSRRAFLRTLGGALAVGFAIQIIGCTEADPLSPSPSGNDNGNCPQPGRLKKSAATDRTGAVSSNHGHTAIVTAAAQDAGVAFVLNITGTASHSHTISLTAQDLTDLKAGLALTKQASTNGHSHTVTFAAITTSILPC
jgi:hypothetical protein